MPTPIHKVTNATRTLVPVKDAEYSGDDGTTDPALAYLASLAPTGRRTMRVRLEQIAELLTGKKTLRAIKWQNLKYEHVAAIRSLLQEQGLAPASVNASLYALRGVAKAAWNLDLMSAQDHARIRNVKSVRGFRRDAMSPRASCQLCSKPARKMSLRQTRAMPL